MTNKREWDRFVRSKERFRVHSYYQSNKVELFNLWLDSNQSWDATVVKVDRIVSQTNESKKGWISVRGKKIIEEFGEEKGNQIIQSRTASGLYYNCDDFPEDVMDS